MTTNFKRLPSLEEQALFWSRVVVSGECREYSGQCNRDGYGVVTVRGPGRKVRWLANRLAWTLARGEIPPGMNVLHRCDNPPCISLEHLFLGTQTENVADMDAKGRRVRPAGELSGTARLTIAQVLALRFAHPRSGLSQERLGQCFGVGQRQVSNIVRGVGWQIALECGA